MVFDHATSILPQGGSDNGDFAFTIYDEAGRVYTETADSFQCPQEPGTYLVCEEFYWGTQRENIGMEYYFWIEVSEDKLDMDGGALFDPHFKPDFNPDLLTSVNYICHLFLAKRELVERPGAFVRSLTGPRIMISFSAARSRQSGSSTSPWSYITGAVTRIPRPATRRASSMPLRQEPAPLWPIMSGWG